MNGEPQPHEGTVPAEIQTILRESVLTIRLMMAITSDAETHRMLEQRADVITRWLDAQEEREER